MKFDQKFVRNLIHDLIRFNVRFTFDIYLIFILCNFDSRLKLNFQLFMFHEIAQIIRINTTILSSLVIQFQLELFINSRFQFIDNNFENTIAFLNRSLIAFNSFCFVFNVFSNVSIVFFNFFICFFNSKMLSSRLSLIAKNIFASQHLTKTWMKNERWTKRVNF